MTELREEAREPDEPREEPEQPCPSPESEESLDESAESRRESEELPDLLQWVGERQKELARLERQPVSGNLLTLQRQQVGAVPGSAGPRFCVARDISHTICSCRPPSFQPN